ncbi:hypothetical protein ACFLZV_02030, partial [Candidatus Margulisiibacteriota bacterium]
IITSLTSQVLAPKIFAQKSTPIHRGPTQNQALNDFCANKNNLYLQKGTEKLVLTSKKDYFKKEVATFDKFKSDYYLFWTVLVSFISVTIYHKNRRR